MSALVDLAALAPERPRPLRRVEYDVLVERGAFDDERVELLDGVVVEMSPLDPPNAAATDRLARILMFALGDRAWVRVQLPFLADGESEPQPDLAVVPPGDYRAVHPSEALLIVEVALSSLRKDRLVKAPLYARSSVLEYWIAIVDERAIEVRRDPVAGVYRDVTRYQVGDVFRPVSFPDLAIAVADVFA